MDLSKNRAYQGGQLEVQDALLRRRIEVVEVEDIMRDVEKRERRRKVLVFLGSVALVVAAFFAGWFTARGERQ